MRRTNPLFRGRIAEHKLKPDQELPNTVKQELPSWSYFSKNIIIVNYQGHLTLEPRM